MTRGADAPVDDFGFVDNVVVIVCGVKTGSGSDGAVDIDGCGALAANEVVVVVADAGFVERRPSCGLDASENSRGNECVQVVVNRLTREAGLPLPGGVHDELGVSVLAFLIDGFQNGSALRGDAQVSLLEPLHDLRMHGHRLPNNLDEVQISLSWREQVCFALCNA